MMLMDAWEIISNPWMWLCIALALLVYIWCDLTRVKADLNRATRQKKILQLISEIDQFIAKTSSTSTQGQKMSHTLPTKIQPLVSEAIVSEIFGSDAWKQINTRVSSDWENAANHLSVNPASEAAVQIKLEALISLCISLTGDRYRYEPQKRLLTVTDRDIKYAKKPDISIIDAANPVQLFCYFSEVYHLLEFKDTLERALKDGRLQAIGYALEVLKCQIELHQSLDRNYVVYASSACTSHIVFSKIELIDVKLRISSSGSGEIALPLVHERERPRRDRRSPPEGIKALLALLSVVPPQQQGALVGPYRLLVVLGMGGFCAAFRARHDRSGNVVAIKLPKILAKESKEAMKALEHEFGILKKLNLISISDPPGDRNNAIPELVHGNDPFQGYIVIADAGTPLSEYILRVRGDRDVIICRIIRNIIGGLDYAHARTICHCDLRVENIIVLIDEHDLLSAQIIDWGLACHVGEVHHHHTGGEMYFHDSLVGVNATQDILTESKFDFASLVYLEVTLRIANGRAFELPWFDDCGTFIMPNKRRAHVVAERAANKLEVFRHRPLVFEMLA